ncbi:NrfD/PsrC family molybdoenzyme membrane anchor subunit [Acidipila rosea]|uniref:Quinol:cytochrome c oxidoreductase quinone-binding subunit 1 n=1 Tax=Acidipila rosea TaxID=768535 RepID=A0A4R1L1E4_9BACT|nr:NrfD/PsrC family molybdoenzyme membrane anchor subunit [Acidipila rosea]MBW4028449.1 polysulfide reductase NrfD [Acidobacteriota bacterium]MBW4046337.1 polysulfide reductase NrfD [Acidobacteriota bacterium]TCK71755.1 quinol:cytochrome c oxidoreductase quinone-binding subunit 1 [Acidipila rosea]
MATKDVKINDPMRDPVTGENRVIAPGHTLRSVTEKISRIVLTSHTPLGWFGGIMVASGVATLLAICVTWLFLRGVGIWGITQPVAWGFAIINFVWWIGIGHAGTLISAILLLFKQTWRNSINRFAEAMTLFAVVCAGMFPLIHVGRPWLGYWLFPYPNTMNVWPQFRSPLLWDVFAVSTYATISVVFWYIGLVPDFGTMRDRAKSKVGQYIYGMVSLGWRGSVRHWVRYETASLLLAGLATPLVLSVHTVISFDFAVALLPGWHTTIFPPYFVAGAIYSGFAMVITLAVPIRKFYHLEDMITIRHIENMGKVMLTTGLIVAYGYSMEVFMAWYSASHWEYFMMWNRMFGPMGWSYWVLITCNIALPQLLWLRAWRRSPSLMFLMSLIVNTGMWFERFVIVVTSLTRDYLPSSWGTYKATRWDYGTFVGTLGLFTVLFFLFIRFVPMIPMQEIKVLLPQSKVREEAEPLPEAGD